MHRGDVPKLAAGHAGPRQEKTFVLPDDPAAATLKGPCLTVDLTEDGNIVPPGLFGEFPAGGGHIILARVQAPAWRAPVPAVRRRVVIPQKQDTVVRVEHDNSARAAQQQSSPLPASPRLPNGTHCYTAAARKSCRGSAVMAAGTWNQPRVRRPAVFTQMAGVNVLGEIPSYPCRMIDR